VTGAQAATLIGERFSSAQVQGEAPLSVSVPLEDWAALARFVKDTLGCRYFAFSTVVDWKDQGLEVVARVDNLDDKLSVVMKTRVAVGVSSCPSLVPVFRGADWMERESFDMFGVHFDGHPDLRRILLSDDWQGHPLLKSYAVDTPHPPYR
jgi:NADH-quinone oxidoreductase subunit C